MPTVPSTAGLFVRRGDNVKGPFTVVNLKQLVADNRVRPSDLIGRSADGPWQPAHTVKGLVFSAPPNHTPQQQPQVVYVQQPAAAPVINIHNQLSASSSAESQSTASAKATAKATAIGWFGLPLSGLASLSILTSILAGVVAWGMGQPKAGGGLAVLAGVFSLGAIGLSILRLGRGFAGALLSLVIAGGVLVGSAVKDGRNDIEQRKADLQNQGD